MTTTAFLPIPRPATISVACQRSSLAAAFWRTLLFCSLFSIIFLPEFPHEGNGHDFLPIYAKAAGGFRYVDAAILILTFCHVAALLCLRNREVRFPRELAWPGGLFLCCIAGAVYYGRLLGGGNFFFDWRGLALGIALFFVWFCWLRNARDITAAVRLFAAYVAVRIALLYGMYVMGSPDTLLGVSIPVFDGPVLSCIVFTALLAFHAWNHAGRALARLLWSSLAGAAYLIILLCFRRTYWVELAIGTLILLLLQQRNLFRNLALVAISVALAASILGGSLSGRLESLDISRTDTEYSAGNADHFYDLVDAWEQVRQSPFLGIGVGTSYPSWHIRSWKSESVMVHNAPLHVWLKYGLAGLICYLWFHLALLRWLYRRSRAHAPGQSAFLGAAFAFVAAQFAVTLGFAPWPYSELQSTLLLSFILAAAVALGRPLPLPESCLYRHSPLSLQPSIAPSLSKTQS